MDILFDAKNAKKYNCEKCAFKCSKQSDYARHISTAKHQMVHSDTSKYANAYTCICGNVYKHSSGLYRHKTSCASVRPSLLSSNASQPLQPLVDASLVLELLKQNQEFKTLIIEQNKQMMELANKAGNTNCNNNINNTTGYFANKFKSIAKIVDEYRDNEIANEIV